MSVKSFEKRFGQSPVFIASTLLENGGVPHSASPGALLKEAIHVISCGYEDKTEWGKEVMKSLPWSLGFLILPQPLVFPVDIIDMSTLSLTQIMAVSYCCSATQSCKLMMLPHLNLLADWMDLRFSHRGYSDWIQDALPRVAIDLLHATPACIQGISTHQSV
jgi:hypothetical protein